MALIRRCAKLLWIRTKFPRLNEKYRTQILDLTNPNNLGYILQLQLQRRTNSRYESNKPSVNSRLETNTAHDPDPSLDPDLPSGMCYADVRKILIENRRSLSSDDQSFGLRLLISCRDMLPDAGLQERRNLVKEAWNLVERLGQTLTVEHYNVLLSIYAKNLENLNAEGFLKGMKAEPNKDTYRLLLDAVAEIGDLGQVLTIMAKTKEMGYPINEATFNSLILAYSVNADVDGAQAVLNTMQAAMIEMSSATYCALARGFAAKGDLTNLRRILRSGNLNAKQLMLVVKSLSNSGHSEHIHHAMKHLQRGLDVRSHDVVCTIVELTHLGKAKDALEIINCISVPKTADNSTINFADFFLHELVKAETPTEEVFEICESLMASGKHSTSLLKVTEAALRLRKEDTALLAFKAMRNHDFEIRPHFYWPLLVNAASNKRESDVIRLIKHMIDNDVCLDDETLQNYMIPFLSTTDPLMIARKLQDCGIKISELLTPLLVALLNKGNLKGAVALTDKITGKIDKDVVIKSLLHGYIVTKNVKAAAKLLKNIDTSSEQNGNFLIDLLANQRVSVTNEEFASMVHAFDQKNLKISRTSAEALAPRISRLKESQNFLETFGRLTDPEMSTTPAADYTYIPHPRNMKAEELENHLADLTTKNMNTRGVLRRLVQTHCSQNNLKKAEEFAQMFTDKEFEWTTGMISGMFSLYAANNMLDQAESRYKELKTKHKEFKIDDHKIIDYATVLVNNHKMERALEVLSEQKNVRHGPETVRNCWRLLNAVAAAGDSKNAKKTLDLLINKGYCTINTHVLGPLIRTYLVNGDLQGAVTQFKECARIYRKLPLQQELIRAVVKTCTDKPEAQEQLMEILSSIKNIHGDAAANSQLFMALAATEKQIELHTLIKMLAVNQAMLKISVQKLTEEKDMTALRTILKACRGVRKLDSTIIYDAMLTLCSRSGDYKTGLEVWEKMQTEDVVPSLQFLEKLRNLLKAQRIPLPPELNLNKGRRKG